MDKREFDQRLQAVVDRVAGNWDAVLIALQCDAVMIENRPNMPCPVCCDGIDRFQYTNKYRLGNYYCRSCGGGDWLKLLMAVRGEHAGQVLRAVEKYLSINPVLPKAPKRRSATMEDMVQATAKLAGESRPVAKGDPVDEYFRNRSIDLPVYPKCLRFHPALKYYTESPAGDKRRVLSGTYPALLALIKNQEGVCCNVHRYYLQDGRLAKIKDPRKQLFPLNGNAVRISVPGKRLGVSEGLENGQAVYKYEGMPMWAGLNADNLASLWIPDHVEELYIYGDNDSGKLFAGELASYTLAQRFMRGANADRPRKVKVLIPAAEGGDWNEYYADRANHRSVSIARAA